MNYTFEFVGPRWLVRITAIVGNIATVLALMLLYLEHSSRLLHWEETTYIWVDTVLCAFMMAEWVILLVMADRRGAYVKARWIDLLASLPLLLVMRPLRIIRLLRVLRLLRGVALVRRALRPWETAVDTALLKNAALAATVVILIGALIVTDLERENPGLNTYGEALWWAIVTSTTVGYGDRVPLTPGGQMVAVILMLLGIGLFGTLAATLTNALTAGRKKPVTNEDLLDRLEVLDARLQRFELHLGINDANASSPPVADDQRAE